MNVLHASMIFGWIIESIAVELPFAIRLDRSDCHTTLSWLDLWEDRSGSARDR